ncbi:MAG: DUF3857 domain-containing protein [Marinoscillum sp.]
MIFKAYKLFFCGLLLSMSFHSIAQARYQPYEWESERRTLIEHGEFESQPLYAIYQGVHYQYQYDYGDFVCYKTTHKIFKVNNEEALQSTNRIYIPLRTTIELKAVKARAITKDGKVTNLDQNNIKELEDEESGMKIFAIEGAEVGGEIEFYYTQKIVGNTFGVEYFQDDYPILKAEFSVATPENLEYEFKVRNDERSVVQTDTTDKENRYHFIAENVPALYEESFSAYHASLKRIDFKLAYNSVAGKKRINTWGDAGKRVYDQVCLRDKSDQKAVVSIAKQTRQTADSGLSGLKAAEHFIKTNYYYDKQVNSDGDRVDFIKSNKFGSARGYTRLYVGLIEYFGLNYELVLSCDRFKMRFDPDFDNWNYLDDYLIYLPKFDLYLAPTAFSFRIGTIPSDMITNYGLFIKPEQIQDFNYPVSRTDQIPEPTYKDNFDNLYIDVSFSDELENTLVHVRRSYLGYSAQYYKASMMVLEDDRKKEMLDETVKFLALDAEIDKINVIESDMSAQNWDKPFTVESDFRAKGYLQRAGNTVLLKVGQLIGPQSEMYQETTRQTEVVNAYNRGYYREITIKIPEGYKVENPESINLLEEVKSGDRSIYLFDASHSIDGQVIKIKIDEWYDQVHYPLADFEAFRKVVNAAADWNKVTLVLKEI